MEKLYEVRGHLLAMRAQLKSKGGEDEWVAFF